MVVQQTNVQLQPGERITLRLTAWPQQAGWLHVGAVLWDVVLTPPLTLHASACCMLRPRAATARYVYMHV